MKRDPRFLITVFWAILISLSPVRSQSIVHDPVHMGANALAFSKDLQEALTQTQQFFQMIGLAKQQWESIKKLEDAVQKVSKYVLFLQDVEDCAKGAAYTIKSISAGVKLVADGELQPYEIRSILNVYTSCLQNVNLCIQSVQSIISDFNISGVDMSTKERTEEIEKNKNKLSETQTVVERVTQKTRQGINERKKVRKMIRQDNVKDMFTIATMLPLQAIPLDPYDELDILDRHDISTQDYDITWKFDEQSFDPGTLNAKTTVTETRNAYDKLLTPASKFFYAVSAIAAIIGVINVISRFNQQGDLSKAGMIWIGTSLFLVLIGYFIEIFTQTVFK